MKAKELAKTKIDDLEFSVVDVETTGMYAEFNRVMDIGIVKVKGGKVVKEWETLINPQQTIPAYITSFTKISKSHVKNKKEFSHFATKVDEMLKGSIFVAHNVYFDYWFLWFEMKRAGYSLDLPKLCTVMLGRKLTLGITSASLDSLADSYGIRIENRHRALPDAKAAADLLVRFIDVAKKRYKAETYFDLYRLQWMRIGAGNNYKGLFDEHI